MANTKKEKPIKTYVCIREHYGNPDGNKYLFDSLSKIKYKKKDVQIIYNLFHSNNQLIIADNH